ncbi:hypothetical protein FB451DRAFT_1404280 [Mycena latifolia]|nr:hypothetical protein FB451DRAFT_1404280 [Mycena latifolia]
MHLQAAVTLATARYMTPARIDLYELHIEKYLRSLLKLYPGTSITPYQHLSLHFGPTLRGFGPTHGYRCWPFERNNNRLQQIPTNKKFGDMEITMLNRFCMSQNLRSLMQTSTLPPEIHGLLPDFERTFNAGEQGTLLNDSLALDDSTRAVPNVRDWDSRDESLLRGKARKLLAEWFQNTQGRTPESSSMLHVFQRSEIYVMGQTFQTSEPAHNFGNSKIVFVRDDDAPTEWSAGRIRQIFSAPLSATLTKTFAVVDVYSQVEGADAEFDYYRQFPIGGGGLFYTELTPFSPVLLPVEKILGHFVYTKQDWPSIAKEHFHALPQVKNGLPIPRGDEADREDETESSNDEPEDTNDDEAPNAGAQEFTAEIARVICRPSPWPATPARHHQPAPPAKSTPNAPRRAGINAAALAMARITRAITPIKTAIAARQLDAHGLTNSPKIGEMIGFTTGIYTG